PIPAPSPYYPLSPNTHPLPDPSPIQRDEHRAQRDGHRGDRAPGAEGLQHDELAVLQANREEHGASDQDREEQRRPTLLLESWLYAQHGYREDQRVSDRSDQCDVQAEEPPVGAELRDLASYAAAARELPYLAQLPEVQIQRYQPRDEAGAGYRHAPERTCAA